MAGFAPGFAAPVLALAACNIAALGRLRPAYAEFGGPWYLYEGSSWYDPGRLKRGIDWARLNLGESVPAYAFHLTLGHHGLFSLTPFFLLAAPGAWLAHRERKHDPERGFLALLAHMAWILTAVLLAFYLVKSDNYGGNSCGARWLQWLTPLLLVSTLPAVDRLLASRPGRWLVMALLAISVMSATAGSGNPWRRPWLYDAMKWLGWPGYE